MGSKGAKSYRVGSKSLRNKMMNRRILWGKKQNPMQLSDLVVKEGTQGFKEINHTSLLDDFPSVYDIWDSL